jgi:hypothetical protein
MRFKTVGAIAAALLVPSVSMAEFAYTGIEASYIDVELDTGVGSVDGDGYRFSGSYQMNPSTFLHGQWEEQNFDFDVDGTAYEFGAGYRHALSSTLDLVGTASYVHAEVESDGLSADDEGLGLGGGIRAQVGSSFQVEAMLRYVDLDESGSDTGLDLLGRYYFNDRYAFTLATSMDDDVDTLSIGFRAEF